MKIFLMIDNLLVFYEMQKVIAHYDKEIDVNYYCSESVTSRRIFSDSLNLNQIIPLNLKTEYKKLLDFDLGLSCHCKQIFPIELIKRVRCINIHPGLNPYNRGWYPQVFSIINKLPIGATIHEMDEKIDHGPIIVQKEVTIDSSDTSKSLYEKIIKEEMALLKSHFRQIIKGDYETKTPHNEGNYNSVDDFSKLCPIDRDKSGTFGEFIDYLRSMTHPPYQNAFYFDNQGNKVYLSLELKKVIDHDP